MEHTATPVPIKIRVDQKNTRETDLWAKCGKPKKSEPGHLPMLAQSSLYGSEVDNSHYSASYQAQKKSFPQEA